MSIWQGVVASPFLSVFLDLCLFIVFLWVSPGVELQLCSGAIIGVETLFAGIDICWR